MSQSKLLLLAAAVAVLFTTAAQAVWSDNFDAYGPGSLQGVGGWKGWDNVAVNAGSVVAGPFASPPNSQQVGGLSDSVHEFSGYTSGVCVFGALLYIPSDFNGKQFFILLNQYKDVTGPNDWSVQLLFTSATGLLTDDMVPGPSLPIIYGQWVPLVNIIDLTNNTRASYYGGNLLSTDTWKRTTGIANIAACDLYANWGESPASPVYYDDMYLTPEPGTISALACGLGGLLFLRRRR